MLRSSSCRRLLHDILEQLATEHTPVHLADYCWVWFLGLSWCLLSLGCAGCSLQSMLSGLKS
jgi:hypothetical protein